MSTPAQCLLYWVEQARTTDDDSDRTYCTECARMWAHAVITGDEPIPTTTE